MKYTLMVCVLICLFTYKDKLYSQTGFWEQTSGPTNGNIQKLIVNSNDYLFAVNRNSGVFRSTNNGTTWTAVNSGITNLDIRALVVNVDGSIYAGGDGVFRSQDNGAMCREFLFEPGLIQEPADVLWIGLTNNFDQLVLVFPKRECQRLFA